MSVHGVCVGGVHVCGSQERLWEEHEGGAGEGLAEGQEAARLQGLCRGAGLEPGAQGGGGEALGLGGWGPVCVAVRPGPLFWGRSESLEGMCPWGWGLMSKGPWEAG